MRIYTALNFVSISRIFTKLGYTKFEAFHEFSLNFGVDIMQLEDTPAP